MQLVPGTKKIALINNDGIVENVIIVRQDSDVNSWVKGTITQVQDVTDVSCGKGCYYSSTINKFYHLNNQINLDPICETETNSLNLSDHIDILSELGDYEVFLNDSKLGDNLSMIDKSNLQNGLNKIEVKSNKVNFTLNVVKCLEVTNEVKTQIINDLKTLNNVLNVDFNRLKQIYLSTKGLQYQNILNQITESDLS